jgi:hypothetical protein
MGHGLALAAQAQVGERHLAPRSEDLLVAHGLQPALANRQPCHDARGVPFFDLPPALRP